MFPNSATAYKSLSSFKPQKSQDVLTKANNQYDIPGFTSRLSNLRGLVGNLTSSVEAVDPSVTGRTTGSFVTEGQRQALVNKERAPILTDLSKQQGALGQEEQGFNTASGLASQMASAMMNEDQNHYQRLLDQYNGAAARDAATESKRQFDVSQANALKSAKIAAGGLGYDVGSGLGDLGGGGGTGTPAASRMVARKGGGFNFTDASGRAINAAQFAHAKGIAFRDLLTSLAKKGDTGAAQALKFVGNDFGYDPRKVTQQWQADLYKALTGRNIKVSKPAGPSYNILTNQGSKNLKGAVGPKINSITSGLGNRLKSNLHIFGL